MHKKLSVPFLAFLQATGLVIYIGLIAWFFSLGPTFAHSEASVFYAPIIMLLLFILSAVVSALLVLGKAGMLFWDKRYREAFTLLGWTLGWGFFYLILILLIFLYEIAV
ncbi:MAG: hypothetical protein ABIH84_02685 [bacterium]